MVTVDVSALQYSVIIDDCIFACIIIRPQEFYYQEEHH